MTSPDSSSHHQQLWQRLRNRDAVIAVVGLGYVGLPLSLAYA